MQIIKTSMAPQKSQTLAEKNDERMSVQHVELAQGRWFQLSLMEQMANVGSEVERMIKWRSKRNAPYAQQAFERALELLDLTLQDPKHRTRYREVARTREALADFFAGINEFGSTDESWRKYFLEFTYAARKDR